MFQINPQKNYPSTLSTILTARYQDCDPLGHLNNVKYLDYFFKTREEQVLEYYDLSLFSYYESSGTGWVAYNHNLSYIRPVMANEKICINTRIVHYDDITVVVEYFITDVKKVKLKTLMWSTYKYIDIKTGKLTSQQEPLLELFKLTALDINFPQNNIINRISEIKEELKQS